jgi:hypothetical protein
MAECIADCEEVLRDPRGGIKKSHHQETEYYARTHAMDCVGYAVCYTDPVPAFVANTYASKLRRIPSPGYLGRGGMADMTSRPPASYDIHGRLRRGPAGTVLPPRRYS